MSYYQTPLRYLPEKTTNNVRYLVESSLQIQSSKTKVSLPTLYQNVASHQIRAKRKKLIKITWSEITELRWQWVSADRKMASDTDIQQQQLSQTDIQRRKIVEFSTQRGQIYLEKHGISMSRIP
ncbi:hypothetical protein Zmor_007692 [Zophobas morio]|uniref:Uncharacterized protein n=1 Tax=Zophobas morio TaxID=2755281 RepID=A0AA38MPP4_9CUCU|nr:hypothetical protein Zmor_007692 [Zophobas morio]